MVGVLSHTYMNNGERDFYFSRFQAAIKKVLEVEKLFSQRKMKRLIIVANRLPVKAEQTDSGLKMTPSAGGLATGLSSMKVPMEIEWVGWPGIATGRDEERAAVDGQLDEQFHPVHLSRAEEKFYYQGFSNEIIWPLFHCFIESVNFQPKYWNYYKKINRRFCEKVKEVARDGDLIWIQDYHLMLLPQMLKAEMPHNPIGFFLHIPFPSYELFRTLPWRSQLLQGLLGADLVGFHTYEYMRHFASSA